MDRRCIHIAAQQHRRRIGCSAGAATKHRGHGRGAPTGADLQGKPLQSVQHPLLRPGELEPDLRLSMHGTAELDQLTLQTSGIVS